MIDQLRNLIAPPPEPEDEPLLPSLRRMAAYLFVATAAGSTASRIRFRQSRPAGGLVGAETGADAHGPSLAAAWAPLLIGPLAAAAQIAHLQQPSENTRAAIRFLNAAVIGVGAVAFVTQLFGSARGEELPSTAPLVFGSVGALGMLVDLEEREMDAERALLRRRADVVERFVPHRRARRDRVVVHV